MSLKRELANVVVSVDTLLILECTRAIVRVLSRIAHP